jgi:hypothetical protein
MNRLVIIGNGFDLAHGLPTSYRHFIEDYWKNVINELKKINVYGDGLFYADIQIAMKSLWGKGDFEKILNYNDLMEYFNSTSKSSKFLFKNKLFEIICKTDSNNKNWVDIENIYYASLLSTIDNLKLPINWNGLPIDSDELEITELNSNFKQIKELLEKYLIEKVEGSYSLEKTSRNPFFEYIKDIDELRNDGLNKFYYELPIKEATELNNQLLETPNPENLPSPTLKISNSFLNFNYTNTLLNYFDILGLNYTSINYLHGRLNSKLNPINFGYGDEMDKMYKEIEEKNDNEYLENIKSFRYLNTPNYKNLLDFIESEKFQVYIMGHSCGLSDRTLLNTIFEHNNCRSIKVFYHQKEDGSDNYTEIIQNISRHFNKKKLMREKIVNKTLCQPLPQIKLSRKG